MSVIRPIIRQPELLSPAGTLKNMQYAFAYGADAVYAGQPRYSLRVRENDFTLERLDEGIQLAHAHGKQFYVAANIAPHNNKVRSFLKDIEPVMAMRPDALIMSDPGLIMLVRERWPDMPVHLSVQANAVNFATVKFWGRQGVSRVILSRELSLDEIGEIGVECPGMELEVFVHGALCIAYSGRCLLSGYINRRDPNQGSCTNACRWKYKAIEAKADDAGNIIPKYARDDPAAAIGQWSPNGQAALAPLSQPTLGSGGPIDEVFLLQEEGRPDQFMPAFEDEHGTYIMNSKDLRAIQHVHRLTGMGIHSLKIEGRTKSFYYVARTAQAYRKAIDDAVAGKSFDMNLMDELEKLSYRGYTEGFYRRHVHDEYQNYERGNSTSGKQQFVGEVIEIDRQRNEILVDVKNRFSCGDSLELMTPGGNYTFLLDAMVNKKGEQVAVAPGSGHQMRIPLHREMVGELQYGLLMRNLPAE